MTGPRYRVHAWFLDTDVFLEREWGGYQTSHQILKTTPQTAHYVIVEDEHGVIYLSDVTKMIIGVNANMLLDLTLKFQTVDAARMAAQMRKDV